MTCKQPCSSGFQRLFCQNRTGSFQDQQTVENKEHVFVEIQCCEKTSKLTMKRTVLGTSMSVLTQQRVPHTWLLRHREGLLRWFFFFCYPSYAVAVIPVSQMAQCTVSYHTNIFNASVLTGQILKFKPHKIGTSYLFICLLFCLLLFHILCLFNNQGDSEQRRMRDPRSAFIRHTLKDLPPPECFSP